MKHFTDLYFAIDSTTSTTAKLDALAAYFSTAPHPDAAWAVALLTGNRLKGVANSNILRQLAIEAAGIPDWLFDECRATVGDLSETVALLLPDPDPDPDPDSHSGCGSAIALHQVIVRFVQPLARLDDANKAELIRSAWSIFNREQRLVYHKLIRGGFRIGVQRRTVARAVAQAANLEPVIIEHRLSGAFSPTAQAFAYLVAPVGDDDHSARPYPFFLARQLDTPPDQLGPKAEWLAEWKWDGIRAQVIQRGGSPSIWSRGEELITHQFPEIASAASELTHGTVLDGEILLWSGNAPLTFASLQHRLNRKIPPAPGLFDTERAIFMAYDLLEHEGQDIRSISTHYRRRALESVFSTLRDDTIRLSPMLDADSWEELAKLRSTSRERGVEGLMLKHLHSTYGTGRTKPETGEGWWKWKIDPFTVDAVLTHAYPGSGRRATLYTDYAFAVWNEPEPPGAPVLTSLTRAYSGLTQDEIEQLDSWIRRNTVRTMGPVREVKPEKVFEIAFEGIARSSRHRSGLALRFPRILRERPDKTPQQANQVSDLYHLLRDPPASQERGP